METTLIASAFTIEFKGKKYMVEFDHTIRRWKVFTFVQTGSHTELGQQAWNGIKICPSIDDAESALFDYLGVGD